MLRALTDRRMIRPLATALSLALLLPGIARADLTYLDATDGAGGNTTLSDGSTLLADDTTGGTTWRQRDNAAFGSHGTVFEGVDPSPEIKTTITGLTPGQSYDIYVHFWDPQSTAEDWNVRAGFASGSLTTFSREAAAVTGSTASVLANTLAYDTAPTLFGPESGRDNLAGFVGSAVADGSGEIEVFIDDFGSTSVNLRSWYDGLSYEPSGAGPDPYLVTYVDATTGNTARWDGNPFAPAAEGNTTLDDNWETRTLGTNGDVLESNADGAEDAPLLVTTLTGLTPDTEYVLFAYFWDATSGNWRIKASADMADIEDNGTGGDPSDDFLPSVPGIHFAADSNDGGTATDAPTADGTAFNTPPLLGEGDRTLMEAVLGTATSDGSGNLSLYIDDLAGVTQDKRTWFDGVGYKLYSADADDDGDSLTNGEETGTYGTDPFLADTDGDGFDDGTEVAAGSNPLNASSVPPLPGNALEVAPDGVWTWFNDERAIFHEGNLYVGYVKGNGQYGVTRYDPATNTSYDMVISTGTSQQQDDHNNPSITVLPDGKLMILYSKHLGGSQFYQRTTTTADPPSSIADWGPEIVNPVPANNTYNNTYMLSGESNRIYNFHRCINFNPTITVSNDLGATWETSVQFIDVGSGGVRPYPRYCSNHTDRIDLIYTDGHPRDVNNSVYHMYYQGDAFHKTDGTLIDSYANLPLDHEGGQRGSVVYQYSGAAWGPSDGPDDWIPTGRGWTWDVHYGADGNPVCVFQVQKDNVTGSGWNHDRIYYYYARWNGSAWERKFIAHAGRPLYSSEDDYGGGMCLDPKDPNVVYFASNAADPFNLGDINNVPLRTNERYEIWRGVTSDGGQTFAWEQLTIDSPADNLRPIIPEDSPYDRTLVWFYGTYSSYTTFDCQVLALLENNLKLESSSLGTGSATLQWRSSPGRLYRIGAATDLTGFPYDAATGVLSQGGSTSHSFSYPAPLLSSSTGFFRVEEE